MYTVAACVLLVAGFVKKCGLLKILHEKYPSAKNKRKQTLESREFQDLLAEAAQENKDMIPHLGKAQEILNPLRVLYLFKSIPDEVYTWSDFSPMCSMLASQISYFFIFTA